MLVGFGVGDIVTGTVALTSSSGKMRVLLFWLVSEGLAGCSTLEPSWGPPSDAILFPLSAASVGCIMKSKLMTRAIAL